MVAAPAEDIKGRALALVQANVRAVSITFASKLPIVGTYIATRYTIEPSDTLTTETTPLLGVLRDPKAFATQQAEGLLRRLLSPLLNRLPDVNALDNEGDADHGLLFKIIVECYVLARDGGGWLFTHVQEHSLVIAPTVSLGHLSTNDLAASTIGTAMASVTGYSIIQGFISALDNLLATAPNRRVKKMWCARTALITGIALIPITNLWTVQSASLFLRLDQDPAVAAAASEFLQMAATGMPGYAMGEIAKRYLTCEGLSNVHTRVLSATAPLNMLLNYLLVNGPVPALRLGFVGAPLCTALSHNAIAGMLIIYIVQQALHEEVDYPSQNQSEMSFFDGMGELAWAGISGVSKSASQLWSKDLGGRTSDVHRLGPNALATQAILLTTATTLYQAPKAISSASSSRVKKWITKGDVQRAKIAASVALVGTLGGAIVISNILIASASSWGALFNNDPVILQSVSVLLPIIAIFQAVHGIGAWVDGSLGALGKSAVFPALNASADYFLGIPLGLYLAFPRRWGLAGLWAGLIVSLTYSCLVATTVLVKTNWKKAEGQKRGAAEGEEE
ncbi:MATE efflux family protein [Gyrodon lividus]|nr:MATE efflux family protein [Gyrodon lividus]